jgi:hypothetical protein
VTLNLTCSFKQRNFKQAEDKRETFNLSMLHVHTHVHANIFICEFYMSSGGGREDPHLCVRRQFCTLPTTLGCFPTQNWGKDNIPEAQVMVKIHQKICPMEKPSCKACERVLTLCRVTSTDSSPCLPTAEKGQRVRVHHPFPVASSHVVFLSFWVCCVFV